MSCARRGKWAEAESSQPPLCAYEFPRMAALGNLVNRGDPLLSSRSLRVRFLSALDTLVLFGHSRRKLIRRGKGENGARNALPHHVGVASIE